LFANDRNRVRGAVLVLSQDGACTGLFENLSVNSLKECCHFQTTFFFFWPIPVIPVAVAVRPISKGEEIFVSYNYGLGENSPEWYRRQYETAAAVAPGGHYDTPAVRSCLVQ
jgi:hypothetical protein